MSTPSPKSPPTMPTMVSRLPKFGLRTKSAPPDYSSHTATANGNSGRLANGFYHQPSPPALGSCTPLPTTTKQNGFLKEGVSASMKWKSGCDKLVKEKELSGGKHVPQQTQGLPAGSPSDSKKPVVIPTAKGRGFGFSPTSLPSPQPQSDRRALPIAKAGSNGPKSAQSVSALPSGRKPAAAGMKALSGSTSSLRRPQSFTRLSSPGPGSSPGSRSSSPLPRKPPASRCHSSEALGSTPSPQMADSDRLRSRSFTQAQRQTSPTFTPPSFLRRPAHSSYSFNRRDVKDTGSRGTVAKPTGSSRLVDPGSKGHKPQSSAPLARPTGATPTPSPLSSLKKPLLPSVGSAPKHSGISYKLSRPSLNKQSRPLKAPPTNEQHTDEGRPEQISVIKHSPERPLQPLGEDGLTTETASQCEMTIAGETLEDMSLSSNSSLDKNDVSQEYMDDFDNLANGGLNLLLLSSKNEEDDSGLDQSCARFEDDLSVNGVIKPLSTGLSFLEASVEWNGMKLNGEQRERRLSQHQRRSSQLDYHEQGGSSLDLSPSDSCGSGGTYMWDEEGLEPLRGTATTTTNSNTTHHIGSFDSDLNSIDLLNNLESCDLDDDDLMLDADVSEEASLHSDGDAISHMAQWRRRQLCWGTQEAHDNSDHQRYKLDNVGKTTMAVCRDANLILDLCSPRSPQLSPGSPGLGMDVEELAEDCCEVRSQLEHLQRLLLQEEDMDEDTLTTDTLSPDASHSSSSCNTQVEVLLQEVQQLREELRSRDQTILQLNQQLTEAAATTRCRCLETKTGMTDRLTQTSRVGTESVASQTPWKEQASQILHSSSCDHQGPLTPPPPAVAPPPAEPRPSPPPLCTDPPDGGATQEERKGAGARCLRQPSKLRRFLSQRPSPVAVVTEASSTKQ